MITQYTQPQDLSGVKRNVVHRGVLILSHSRRRETAGINDHSLTTSRTRRALGMLGRSPSQPAFRRSGTALHQAQRVPGALPGCRCGGVRSQSRSGIRGLGGSSRRLCGRPGRRVVLGAPGPSLAKLRRGPVVCARPSLSWVGSREVSTSRPHSRRPGRAQGRRDLRTSPTTWKEQ
jgi:hypothetical protein